MSAKDGDLLESVLLDTARKTEGRLRVLEWGSGKSTLYFTKMLAQSGIAFEWVALEHDRRYFQDYLSPRFQQEVNIPVKVFFCDQGKVTPYAAWNTEAQSSSGIQLVVFDYGLLNPYRRPEDRRVNMDDYISYPASLEQPFDIIMVDGRKRRRCLLQALEIAGEKTIVFCHDAHRAYYHCAFNQYSHHRLIGDWLWVGSRSKQVVDLVRSMNDQSFSVSRFFTLRA
ncbi:MAG: hypothetical protein SF029_22805 [bacterium]|nr:hypothetical protein [bacterium]